MQRLIDLFKKKKKIVIGLMTGTSMDGIDAALVNITNSGNDTKIEPLKFITVPYPKKLRERLLIISQHGGGTVDEICRLNFLLAQYYVEAIFKICKISNIDISEVDLIGTHGQTIHHLPDAEEYLGRAIRSTLQIGEPSFVATKTGVVTVGNFRSADLALDGQGAPLIPYFDFLLFNSEKYNRVLLNIGGIANVTILLKKSSAEKVLAFDTGPGNMVINALMKKYFNKDYDENGSTAQKGKISVQLLKKLKSHFYFSKPLPKSTGREEFGNEFVKKLIKSAEALNLSSEDIIATATELTAQTIADAIKYSGLVISQVDQLIVSGGGVHNKTLMKSLRKKFSSSEVLDSDSLGISGDAKEAICFAVLANETICGNPANLPSVTGAERATVLGSISLP